MDLPEERQSGWGGIFGLVFFGRCNPHRHDGVGYCSHLMDDSGCGLGDSIRNGLGDLQDGGLILGPFIFDVNPILLLA
jgi:hypothetical protein